LDTVFAVVHGCQPKFTIPEILQEMHRAVRHLRSHAAGYRIDPYFYSRNSSAGCIAVPC